MKCLTKAPILNKCVNYFVPDCISRTETIFCLITWGSMKTESQQGDSDWPSKSDAPWNLANFQYLVLFEIMKLIHHLTSLEKLKLKIAISLFFFQIITLTVTKEEQLKDMWVVYRYSSSSNLSIGVLQVSVLNGNHISEVKRSVNCTASNIHRLQIQLSTRRHQN